MKAKLIFLLILLGFLGLGLTACEAEDVAFLQAMAEEWAQAKNINPTNADGSINFGGLVNAGTSLLGGSGDPETDAAVQAGAVIESIKAADDSANKALAIQDLKSADDAIKQRPNDYHYHVVRGVVLLANGSPADAEWTSAGSIAVQQNSKLTKSSLQAALDRDRMNTIEQALGSKTLSPAGKDALKAMYCADARSYADALSDIYFLTRALSLGMNCVGP